MMPALIIMALAVPPSAAVLLLLLRAARPLHRLALALAAAEVVDLLLLAAGTFASGPYALGRYWRADAVSGFFLLTIACVFALVIVYARSWLQDHATPEESEGLWTSPRIFYAFLFLFLFTMVGVCLAANLGLMWILLEGTTLSSALLVGFEQTEGALEAGWKYLILCSVGIAFALFGTIVFYLGAVKAGVPPVLALDWPTLHLLSASLATSAPLLHLAFVFLLVGFGTKIGLAPMHSWLPDAHAEAPAPISALLSAALLGCALYCLLRYEALMPTSAGVFARHLLLFFGAASMLLAAMFSVVQKDLKRLFAYSSMEHMGLIAIGLGVGTPLALYGALLHLLNHALAKTLLFCSAGEVKRDCGTLRMATLRGLLRQQPATGAALLAGGAAIVGLPPLALFVSEFAILAAAFSAGHLLAGFVVLLSLAVVLAAFLRHFLPLLSDGPAAAAPAPLRRLPALVFSVATLALLIFGIHVPGVLHQAIARAVQVLHG